MASVNMKEMLRAPEDVLVTDGVGRYTVYYDASRRYYGALARRVMRDPVITAVMGRSKRGMFATNVEQFLFNALVCRQRENDLRATEPGGIVQIAVPLSEMFRKVSRYRRLHMSYRQVKLILSAAKEAGWITVDMGTTSFNNGGKGGYVTRVHPIGDFGVLLDKHLTEMPGNVAHIPPSEVIVLADRTSTRSRLVEYESTEETDEMRERVEALNIKVRGLDISISIEDNSTLLLCDDTACNHVALSSPSRRLPLITCNNSDRSGKESSLVVSREWCPRIVAPTKDGQLESVNLTDHIRPLHRGAHWIWTLDDWALTHVRKFARADWECGGRLYAPYQNLPKVVRPHIKIGGERTIALDFSAIHPAILYHMAGVTCDGHPYVTDLPVNRKVMKEIFLTMINATSAPQLYEWLKAQVKKNEIDLGGCSPKEVVHALVARNAPIKRFLYSDAGIRLQRVDSEIALIIMERVDCLGIHDGFIARRDLRHSLEHEMKRAYRQVVGGEIEVKEDSLLC